MLDQIKPLLLNIYESRRSPIGDFLESLFKLNIAKTEIPQNEVLTGGQIRQLYLSIFRASLLLRNNPQLQENFDAFITWIQNIFSDKMSPKPLQKEDLDWFKPSSFEEFEPCGQVYQDIEEGECVSINSGYWILCDYGKLISDKELDDFIAQTNAQWEKFKQEVKEVDVQKERLNFFSRRVADKISEILPHFNNSEERIDLYENFYMGIKNFKVVPISKNKKTMCAEKAAFAHYLLKKLGISNSFVNGQLGFGDQADCHSFIYIDDDNCPRSIFDPTLTISEQCQTTWLFPVGEKNPKDNKISFSETISGTKLKKSVEYSIC